MKFMTMAGCAGLLMALSGAAYAGAIDGSNVATATIDIFEVLLVVIFVGVFSLPTIRAVVSNHPRRLAIILINIFLGWTVIGWIVSFIWAFKFVPPTQVAAARPAPSTPPT